MEREKLAGAVMSIDEHKFGNARQWAVRLTGSDRAALRDRAEEIRIGTQDLMMSYMSASRDGHHEIQMEFRPKEAAQ